MNEIPGIVRKHVSNGNIDKAIEALMEFLQSQGGDLYNQAIHIKGQYSDYHKALIRGTGDQPEIRNKISWSILDLASQIENQGKSTVQNDITHTLYQASSPQPAAAPRYYAQCFFNGDPLQYFVSLENKISCVNPMTNQTFIIGMKMPSQDFRYAWTYYIQANGMYYMVDHAGVIWGQNFGMPAQMGHVKYF